MCKRGLSVTLPDVLLCGHNNSQIIYMYMFYVAGVWTSPRTETHWVWGTTTIALYKSTYCSGCLSDNCKNANTNSNWGRRVCPMGYCSRDLSPGGGGCPNTSDIEHLHVNALAIVTATQSRTSDNVTPSHLLHTASKNSVETGGRGRSRSLKMAPFDRSYTTFCWSATTNIALSCTVFELFDVK